MTATTLGTSPVFAAISRLDAALKSGDAVSAAREQAHHAYAELQVWGDIIGGVPVTSFPGLRLDGALGAAYYAAVCAWDARERGDHSEGRHLAEALGALNRWLAGTSPHPMGEQIVKEPNPGSVVEVALPPIKGGGANSTESFRCRWYCVAPGRWVAAANLEGGVTEARTWSEITAWAQRITVLLGGERCR